MLSCVLVLDFTYKDKAKRREFLFVQSVSIILQLFFSRLIRFLLTTTIDGALNGDVIRIQLTEGSQFSK